jgi:hypothetical protein
MLELGPRLLHLGQCLITRRQLFRALRYYFIEVHEGFKSGVGHFSAPRPLQPTSCFFRGLERNVVLLKHFMGDFHALRLNGFPLLPPALNFVLGFHSRAHFTFFLGCGH